MKKTFFIAAAVLMIVMFAAESQAGGRSGSCGLSSPKSYSSSGYGSFPSFKSYSAPAPRNYKNGGEIHLQNGYLRGNGTYVDPHLKTRPDNTPYNNLGTWSK